MMDSTEQIRQETSKSKQIEDQVRMQRERIEKLLKTRTKELSSTNDRLDQEIAEKKRVEEQLRQLEQAVENMQLGVTIANLDGKIIYTNQTEADMHGYTKEELIGQNVNRLAPPELRKPLTVRQIRKWKGLVRESVNIRKDGSTFPVWLMSEIVKNAEGEPCAIVTSCEDITERKAIEEERQKYRDQLEELVRERTTELMTINEQLQQEITERTRAEKELQRAKEAAESANRAKSDFLANMSHELRTPLNGVLGYTQILKNDLNLEERQQHAIDVIHRSGEHLLMMISDILDLSKIEAQKMVLEPGDFPLPDMLKTIVEIARIRADQKEISFDYHPSSLPAIVHGDEKRLRQILLNLLSNATKFTQQGGVIFKVASFPIDSSPAPGVKLPLKRFHFEVEDSGIGISQEHLDEIFSAFHQIRDRRMYTEGTGLGLAISQRLVRLMGGELYVRSRVGEGSTFWFDIELSVIEEPKEFEKPLTSEPYHIIGFTGGPFTILLVDDNETNRAVLKDLLMPLGFQIIEAFNGQDALEKASHHQPDLVFMDIVMPVMDGLEATQQIRALPAAKNIVIIAISASVADEKRQECLTAGCNYFLSKPLRVTQLLELIRSHLKLEWVYAKGLENPQAGFDIAHDRQILTEELMSPPQEELATLYTIARGGMITRLKKHLEMIEAMDSNYAQFTARIRQLMKEFQIEKIQTFIQQYLEGDDG